MGVSAIIEDGMVANATSTVSKASEKGEGTLGKDDFLQLLTIYGEPITIILYLCVCKFDLKH